MADDPKKKDSKPSGKPKPKSPPSAVAGGAGPPGMDPAAGGPPLGMPPVGGGAMGAGPAMGASPPMPGSGIDPYAALMGQVSQAPMSMPMGQGPGSGVGDMFNSPGSGGAGMGLGVQAPGMETQGSAMAGQPNDDITRALMSDANPARYGADLAEHSLDPAMPDQQQMSMQQILQLLALAQGGLPMSGLPAPGQPGSVAVGMGPNELQMG